MKIRPVAVAVAMAAATAFAASPAVASESANSATHPSVTVPTPGPGWLVAAWDPHPRSSHPVRYIELVSPEGNRFILYRLHNLSTQVNDWSGDGTRLLFVTYRSENSSLVSVVDLATGQVEDSFKVSGGFVTATFTRPDGRAIYVDGGGGLIRYSLSGTVEARFPATIAGLGVWTDSWLESPDGLYLVLGTQRGLALFSNDGTLLARLPNAVGRYCQPESWWSADEVLASCPDRHRISVVQLVEFSTSGGPAHQFVRVPHGGFGYTDAYQVGDEVLLQGAVTCGLPYLAELQGTTPVRVNPPVPGSGDLVVSTTSTSLALLSSDGCAGQNFVSWYTPATNSLVQVLGAPLSSGSVVPLGYPNPIATGSPASNPYG
jgi:hypothetical protein